MKQIKYFGYAILGLTLVMLVVLFSRPATPANLGHAGKAPIVIPKSDKPFMSYGMLSGVGDVVYYRLHVDGPQDVPIRVDIPQRTGKQMALGLVVLEPSDSTIGPVLPFTQPPQTTAMVYPMTTTKERFDPQSQVNYAVRLEAKPHLSAAGTYLIAVYNSGSVSGPFRFIIGDPLHYFSWSDMWMMPGQWWQGQLFAGITWCSFLMPALVLLALWLVYMRLDHHQLHVHKSYPARVTKIKKKKQS